MIDSDFPQEYIITPLGEDSEATCWGCGLRLLLPHNTPIYKCGWCGAITHQNVRKQENTSFKWRQLRDRCFVCVLIMFMLFVICGGIWAIYPFVYSVSYLSGILHSIITIILAVTTVSSFSLASFRCAGTPPNTTWGSYPVVGKDNLQSYSFCHYCSKPKSPRSHHCRSCGMCILDMDHHCPFIGNCVGASNHRHFIVFLISAVISTIYVSIMSFYVGFNTWPSLRYKELSHLNGDGITLGVRVVKEITMALLTSTIFLSTRGLVLIYLFVSSVSVQIGLSILLWQQLSYIYEGKTYLENLSSQSGDGSGKDCQNISRFFGCPFSLSRLLPNLRNSPKIHNK